MGYCINCKAYGNGNFCEYCGTRLTDKAPEKTENNENAQKPENTQNSNTQIPAGFFMPMGQLVSGQFTLGVPQETGFRIEYSTTEMMFNGGFTLKAWEEDGKYKALYRTPGVDIRNAPVFDVDNSFIEQIKILMNASNCESWNGFSGHAQGVMDGTSYSFSYSDGEGKHVSWGGYMARPDGFGAAGGVLRAMFDEIYDERYPNYYKRMAKYLDDEVKQKYGLSRQGSSKIFYRNKNETSFDRYGWTAPAGCLFAGIGNYSVISEYNKPPKEPGIEAFTVFLDPYTDETRDSAESTGEGSGASAANPGSMTFRWYKADKEGVRLTGEVTPTTFVLCSDEGYTQVFSYRAGDTTYFGFFSRLFFSFGKDCIDYTLLLYSFRDGKWQWLDGIHNRCDINDISREDLDGFINFARKYGMNEVADRWDSSGKPDFRLIDYNVIVNINWSTNLNNDFFVKLNETPIGELAPGYEINVSTAVYRCYFPM